MIVLLLAISLAGCSTNQIIEENSENIVKEKNKEINEIQEEISEKKDDTYIDSILENKEELEVNEVLNDKQLNSIAMLNYLAVTSQKIDDSKNNRLYLEEVYNLLMDNINPDKIDINTEDRVIDLLDTIYQYRLVDKKRERLDYIYNQYKAMAIKEAMPNPMLVLSAASTLDWKKFAGTVLIMAVDSYNNYDTYNKELDLDYLKDNWDLEDEEEETFHKNKKSSFKYMVDIVQENDIPGNKTLNSESVEAFSNIINKDNNMRKMQFLEEEQETYEFYGEYWLELAKCYYENEQYDRVLNCIAKYDSIYTGIFRKDINYSEVMPLAIISSSFVLNEDEYIIKAEEYSEKILKNTNADEWGLRYFAAEIYMDLFSKTNDVSYLEKAYKIVLNNVNYLVDEQLEINKIYLSDVQEIKISDQQKNSMDRKELSQEKKRVNSYNKQLKETRETELLDIYEPLILNCDLLFGLAEELNISEAEKSKIEQILQTDSNGVFLSKPINDRYSFGNVSDYSLILEKNKIYVPLNLLTNDSNIVLTITNGNSSKTIKDLQVKTVNRNKSHDINQFQAEITSDTLKDIKWTENTKVNIQIFNGNCYTPIEINFKVKEIKEKWILPNEVEFEKV
ncbi:hypothetical protein [Floccifex sp.]|uniref:hypothetical protein n=1 Tax=Floccifex sp. TaxID=2815810 RepID=UPI003F016004